MRYMLLVYGDERGWDTLSEEQQRQIVEVTNQNLQRLKSGGQYVTAAPLHPTSTATSVRMRDGVRLVTDGPFAETKEQLGGFYLIEAKDLEEAIDLAAGQPGVSWDWGAIEIRPVMELAGLPTASI